MDLLCVIERSVGEGVDVINNGLLRRDFIPNTLLQICVSQLINQFYTSISNYPKLLSLREKNVNQRVM